jgi:hypothetical protein
MEPVCGMESSIHGSDAIGISCISALVVGNGLEAQVFPRWPGPPGGRVLGERARNGTGVVRNGIG